jgi:glycosyltransferase involved in cell wall biosynthesis
MTSPTVSIVVPTYNREALLPRALDSIVAQTFNDWEIVLVDDGSTDGTEEVAARYADHLKGRLVYIPQMNRGSSSARNRGIDASRGQYIAFLDSDDEFLPHKLERQLALFDARPDLGLVYSDYAYVDLDGVYHASAFDTKFRLAQQVPSVAIGPGLHVCAGDLFDVLLRGYFIATIVGMVPRKVLGETIRFAADQAYAEEWLFYLQVARNHHAGFVDEPLCIHHHVEGSLARTDKHRNTLRHRDLLSAIEDTWDDLTCEQRKVIRRNLQQTCRQLGYDTHRAGKHREALGYFVESLGQEPGLGTLGEAVRATGRWLVGGRSGRLKRGRSPQEPSQVVR